MWRFLLVLGWLDVPRWCLKVSFPDFLGCCLLPFVEIPVKVLLLDIIYLASLLLDHLLPLSFGLNLSASLHLLLQFPASVDQVRLVGEVFLLVGILLLQDSVVVIWTMIFLCEKSVSQTRTPWSREPAETMN